MALPSSKVKTERVELSGGYVDIRGLSVDEADAVGKLSGAAQNILGIAYATGESHDAVKAWYHNPETSASDAVKLAEAVSRLSGLDGAATFPRTKGNDAVVEQTPA